jgi:D-psicose/D-tagatose/L-ribulose 3-epimerase
VKFGISMLLWTPTVGEEHTPLLVQLKEWGYDGVEVPVNDFDDAHYARLKKTLDDIGLESVAVGFVTEDSNPISPDPAIRRAAVERLKRELDRGKAMGGTLLGGPLHSAYATFVGRGPTEDEKSWCAEVLHEAGEYAATLDMSLAIEFLNRFECYFANTAAQVDEVARLADHPAVRTLYDTHHSHFEEDDVARAIESCAGTLGHVQLSENHRGVPGRGQVDWKTTFDTFKKIGYDEWFVIESFSRVHAEFGAAVHIWRDFCD